MNFHQEFLNKAIKEKEAIKSELHSASLDLVEEGVDNTSSPIYQRLDNLKCIFDIELHQENLKKLDEIIMNFKDAIDAVFEKESKINITDIEEDEIKINFDFTLDELPEEEIEELENQKLKIRTNDNDYVTPIGLIKGGAFQNLFK